MGGNPGVKMRKIEKMAIPHESYKNNNKKEEKNSFFYMLVLILLDTFSVRYCETIAVL